MTHKPIHIHDLSFVLPHKTCFLDVELRINAGDRIAVIGANGAGKSTLLTMIMSSLPKEISCGYVPQLPDGFGMSGAQIFHQQLSTALALDPHILILDEPTNHLDRDNRRALRRMLTNCSQTLVVASHDQDFLEHHFDKFFCLDDGKLSIFSGSYGDLLLKREREEQAIMMELAQIHKERVNAHEELMREQNRAKASRLMGEKGIKNKKWPTIVSTAKARRAENTTGKKKSALRKDREDLVERLSELKRAEIITPKFHFASREKSGVVLSLRNAGFGYAHDHELVGTINFDLHHGERLALLGKNASGKSSFLRAVLDDGRMKKTGSWMTPAACDIGYLDQHYRNLDQDKSAFSSLSIARPDWGVKEIRDHLNSFLFRKNEEVNARITTLSGGERARLSLALIASSAPRLLLLDEITNNVDHKTREHILSALKSYTGALIVVSHDEAFLKNLKLDTELAIEGNVLVTLR